MDLTIFLPLLPILVLLLLSAFFSGSETALTAASKARLTAWEKEGNKRAGLVNRIRAKKDRMIGALLLGNNLVNILASALATSFLISVFGEAGVFYATIAMTLLVLIFAEVLPKTYALHHAETMSMAIAPIFRLVILIFAPVTEAVTWIVRNVLKLFGVDISKVTAGSHLELLRGVIDMQKSDDDTENEKRAMLRSILDLADVEVEDIMVHRKNVVMLDYDAGIEEIVQEVLDCPYTRVPIWRDDHDNIVGIVHAKLLLRALHAVDGNVKKLEMHNIMLEPWFIPETTELYDQLQAFRDRREHFAVVVDEYGSFMGIVTLEDILEEIVGEIDDEHDHIVEGVKIMDDGSYLMDGEVTIRDINREFDWNLPHEDYSTIAGLVLHEAQILPEAGQKFSFFGYRFDVIRRNRNQISKLRVRQKLAVRK